MNCLLLGGNLYIEKKWICADMLIENGSIAKIGTDLQKNYPDLPCFDLQNKYVFPGFIDVHVHFREPGFSVKETIESGSKAAAHGGYTHVCTMPNLNPVPDTVEHLSLQQEIIKASACIHVYPYGSITMEEKGEKLQDLEAMANAGAVAFSDDGKGVQAPEIMTQAMKTAAALNKIIAAHCEDNSLLFGGYIHDGDYARTHGHKGICSESEWKPVERDLELAKQTECAYHVCHISTRKTVELIRKAKAEGVNVTCETAPHYLILCDKDLQEDGRFKMNPPLRTADDRQALLEAVQDGTIDMIATDHAPHTAEEKSKGLAGSLMGIVGLETAFSLLYTHLVKTNLISLEQLIHLLHHNPAARFGIGNDLTVGNPADFTVFDLDAQNTIDPEQFLSKGRSTPFAGEKVWGRCLMTFVKGELVWQEH